MNTSLFRSGRLLALFLIVILLLSPAFAEENDWYADTAKALTENLGAIICDRAYLDLTGLPEYGCILTLRKADFENPISAWRYDLPPVKGLLAILGVANGTSLSGEALSYYSATYPKTIPVMYNGKISQESLSAASAFTYERSYAMPGDFKPCIIALELDHGAIATVFHESGDEIVTATVCPLFGPEDTPFSDVAQSLTTILPMAQLTQLF